MHTLWMSAVAVYYRLGDIVVVPQAGGGGHFIDIEPITVVPPEANAVRLAVCDALRVSAANRAADNPGRGWKTPLLKRFRVKSYKAFIKDASLCFVFADAGVLEVECWHPARDGRGLEPAPGGSRVLKGDDGLGAAVIESLGANRSGRGVP